MVGKTQLEVSDFKALKMIKRNTVLRSISSKLITDPTKKGTSGREGKLKPEDGVMNNLSDKITSNIEDIRAIFQALPDTKIAMEIWSSCILSPKDGVTETLLWSVDVADTDYSAVLFNDMLSVLRDYFETDYNIYKHLKPAIEDALFKTGSYPLVIIPESSLDDIINGKSTVSSESFINTLFIKENDNYRMPSMGILGSPSKVKGQLNVKKRVGLESLILNDTVEQGRTHYDIHENMTITDNPEVLKVRRAISSTVKRGNRLRVREHYALEGFAKVEWKDQETKVTRSQPFRSNAVRREDADTAKRRYDTKVRDAVAQKLYQDRAYTPQDIINVPTGEQSSRMPETHPLVMKIPSSAIIPVHTPGDPTDIVGAFIILDEFGNPLSSSPVTDLYNESRRNTEERRNQAISIIKQMNFYNDGVLSTKDRCDNDRSLNDLAKTYASLFEEDLISRLSNGLQGGNVKISRADEVYRIMFARALTNMRTQVLYIPGDLLVYFAFDYNEYGIGKSLLEDVKNIAAMRTTLTYADLFAGIMNSIGRRKILATLDEAEIDPVKTLAEIRANYVRATAWNLPLLDQGPVDSINVLRESAIDLVVEGETPALPSTKIDVEDVRTDRARPDDDLRDQTKNIFISSLGLPPSIVDDTQETEFATTVIQSNMLLNKRTLAYQEITSTRLIRDFVTKYSLNSGGIIKLLSSVIKEHEDKLTPSQRNIGSTLPIIEDFLDRVDITLPPPDGQQLEAQKEEIENYKSIVDAVVDNLVADTVVEELLPASLKEKSSGVGEMLKSILMARYLNERDILPSLRRFISPDNAEDNTKAEIVNNFKPLLKTLTESYLEMFNLSKSIDSDKLKKLGEEDEDNDSYSSDYGEDETSSDVDDGNDDAGGDNGFSDSDFDFDIDSEGDDTDDDNSEEETEEGSDETTDDEENETGF